MSVVPTEAGGRPARAPGALLRKGASSLRSRNLLILAALVASALAGSWFPEISAPFRSASKAPAPAASQTAVEGLVKLTAEQIAAAKIEISTAGPGVLTRDIVTPALVMADPDRVGRVAAKVAGTVAELRKKLGDSVEKGEVVAVIDSREVADAKSEYLAAVVNYDLQNTLFQREKGLFEKKITAEQLYLKAQTAFTEAKLRVDLARQKLAALDLSDSEIATLPKQPVRDLRRKDIHATVSGKVIERRANVGQPVGGEGQEKELYVLADLTSVWTELSVPIAVLPDIREKQLVRLSHGGEAEEGRIVFISPMLNHETHSGRVIARFDNKDSALRPGTVMTARIALAEKPARVKVPRTALQTVGGEPAIFVRTPDGFVKRKVETGESDDGAIEILSGLDAGETFAATNTFLLKSELGKAELETLD
ncbi:MAG: efflux transporter periplasmic adaptor subunit [Methylocystaceae bacterium]|nr:MAG: efflux transporter periplasmic adaptor subunit [Methylocystaceae bacterium]